MAKTFFKKGEVAKMSHALLHNRFVLYFIFILAVSNVFHFVFTYDLSSVAVFIAAGLLTSFFSKNMVVIMVVAMVVANVFRIGNGGSEGFKSKKDTFQNALDELNAAVEELDNMGTSEEETKSKKKKSKTTMESFSSKNMKLEKHDHASPGEEGHEIPQKHHPKEHTEHKK